MATNAATEEQMLQVSAVDFIKSPALYLEKVEDGVVQIIRDGCAIAILAKPNPTPIADSLLGILKDTGLGGLSDIKALKVGR